ncbi:hypothetical protein CEP52_016915 [Fusarium oligoseptatum]|uniref:Uncharacterized protein n=1 Tax=Fusarium oligoseptatum TaxID=2604345 RepID=A0A428RYV0_9HYPO|nr:hypothetical protein CEP52_016915 [Fusarium oligoseptatum]
MPPLPEDPKTKITKKHHDQIRQMAYAGKGTSASSSTSGSSLSDASSQDSQVPPPQPSMSQGQTKPPHEPSKSFRPTSPKPIPQRGQQGQLSSQENQGTGPRVPGSHSGTEDSGKPSNPRQDSSPSTTNHEATKSRPPLSEPHQPASRPGETTGKDSRSKPKTRTAPEAGSKEKASPNPPQPDRFDGSQARDDSHEAKASQHQASFKPAATGAFQGIVSVVTAPFRWLEMLWSLMIAFGWAIVQNFPSVLLFLQTLLALIAAKFGKGTVVQIKDWVSDSAGTVAGSAKAILDSKHADVLEAYGWNKDIPYEKLPPVLPLVIHIEIWEPGLKLAFRDVDSLQPLIPDLDLGDVARKKKQMPIEMAKKLKKLNSLFVSELTKSLGPSRIVMTELLWKIEHHPVKDILYSDMKASTSSLELEAETSWLTNWWKPKTRARTELENRLKSTLGVFKTSLHDRSSLMSRMYGQQVTDLILDTEATESDDDTFRLWLSAHDLENTAGGQAVDEDQIAWSKALTGMSNTYSNVKAVCETISLDKEIFMEASKLMADEIKHLKKAINSLETTQNNLKGFDDEQFNVDYARRVETKLLAEEVRTWLDVTKKYYGKDSEEE